jgi:hypothetical protein
MATALVAGGAVMAPTASAEAATSTRAADEQRFYIFSGHFYSKEACVARAEYKIATEPWNYYDYVCVESHVGTPDEVYTLQLAFYA